MTVTLDTNILVYVVDGRDPSKQKVAARIFAVLAARTGPLALQVIGEFQHVLVRRLRLPRAVAAAAGHQLLASFKTFEYDAVAVEQATSSFATGRFSYWDGLLLASADSAGIQSVISEDMSDGARFGRVEVVHPFDGQEISRRARAVLGE
jgi:predicted nucleic acid-binding protein